MEEQIVNEMKNDKKIIELFSKEELEELINLLNSDESDAKRLETIKSFIKGE